MADRKLGDGHTALLDVYPGIYTLPRKTRSSPSKVLIFFVLSIASPLIHRSSAANAKSTRSRSFPPGLRRHPLLSSPARRSASSTPAPTFRRPTCLHPKLFSRG